MSLFKLTSKKQNKSMRNGFIGEAWRTKLPASELRVQRTAPLQASDVSACAIGNSRASTSFVIEGAQW